MCALSVLSCFPPLRPLPPPVVGVGLGLATLEAFHASNNLITHTHIHTTYSSPVLSFPSSSEARGRESHIFGLCWLEFWLRGGLGSHGGLTVEVL